MKLKLLLATASVACMGIATSATAHDDEGWYLRGNAGYGIHTDVELYDGLLLSEEHGNGLQSEGNVAGSLGAGYDFGNNWRVELDGDSLWTDLGSISGTPNSAAKLRTNTAMINALYDFDIDALGKFEPYVGVGVGLVQAQLDAVAHDFINEAGTLSVNPVCVGQLRTAGQGESCSVNDDDTALGYQLLAGLGYEITDNLTWDTHYTYLDSQKLQFDSVRTNGITGATFDHIQSARDVGAHTLLTGLRYRFGHDHVAPVQKAVALPPPPPPPPPPVQQYVAPAVNYIDCPDGSVVVEGSSCPIIQPQVTYTNCPDGSVVVEGNSCPIIEVAPVRTNLNVCGSSNVGIFNVNTSATPKQMTRLGTLPEFGDSHGVSADGFFQKLQARYSSSATDKAYLNYLFKSMGYSNGFADAESYMFSEDVLPVGTAGLLGLGKQHHYNYSILPSNDRDRQAFRIQSANGTVVHFMKTCGNYFYGCE